MGVSSQGHPVTFILTNYFCCDPISIQGRFWGGDLNLPLGAEFSPSQWSLGPSGLSGAWVSESLPDTLPLGHELNPPNCWPAGVTEVSAPCALAPTQGIQATQSCPRPWSTREPVGDRPPQAPGGVPGLGPGNTLGWFCVRTLPDEPPPADLAPSRGWSWVSRVHWSEEGLELFSGAHTLARRVSAEKPDRQALFRASAGGRRGPCAAR